ncbi:YggS family pyridoxal phosphate-dependent enzyme [Geoalkalibacter sp.]|uniref:YggS family pyridoxal phosphate-dependent enzyme n=1 Tax=Geoalkalibacter sp. TaxID=3041440 RepID=UPI00272EB407|nr:YggS family pyridoxal phosphate-dependent enzyme [Geoalkalibacter sp.]
MTIAANLHAIQAEITAACRRANRDPRQVRLVAVSKTKPAALIDEAHAAGQPLFGESYVQEFIDKVDAVRGAADWHFIGHLQSNKVKYLRGRVGMIHSVDRLSLAEEINRQWARLGRAVDVLVQVNLGDEDSKSGVAPDDAVDLVRALAALPHLRVRGLMCLPPFFDDAEQVRPFFRRLRELAAAIAAQRIPGVSMDELSMGMSHDFVVAIEEGATLVRIGTAIFGERA